MNALRVSEFNSTLTSVPLLYELFTQGGPIKNINIVKRPEPHAIIRFQHDESVPYCIALFDGIELHGRLLRLNPLRRSRNSHSYLEYLHAVRHKLRDEFSQITPPNLPPKIHTNDKNGKNSESTQFRQTGSPKKRTKEKKKRKKKPKQVDQKQAKTIGITKKPTRTARNDTKPNNCRQRKRRSSRNANEQKNVKSNRKLVNNNQNGHQNNQRKNPPGSEPKKKRYRKKRAK